MSFIRQTSRNRLIAASTALVAVGVASVAVAAGTLSASAAKPPAKPLASALADAAAAPDVAGVTARVTFTNRLLDAAIAGGNSPLVAGGSGRLWASADGRFRLEIQSPSGDAQIVGDGTSVTVVQPATSTVYRFVLPARTKDATATPKDAPPTAADIQKLLDRVAGKAQVSGATPTTVAGQPAYEVRVGPADNGGLVGAVALAWDAARGVPLRVGIYARGATQPTLELSATDISYGPISSSALAVGLPAGAKVQTVDLAQLANDRQGAGTTDGTAHAAETPAQVQAKLAFSLHAPATVAGLTRTSVHSVGGKDGDVGALVVYGHGLGSIVVLEQKADPAAKGNANGLGLPTVSIGGASGTELSTALGSIVRVTKGGVQYTVIGSVPAAAAEAAARDAVA